MTVWNRDDAEAYLLRRINYETQLASERADSFRLRSMQELVERLGHPERCAPVVHVAGTKGKGSTSSMTAAILQSAGMSVGLYTSPHLLNIEERIVVNGKQVTGVEFAAAIQEVAAATEAIDREIAAGTWDGNPPTYFDILTAAAWCVFRDRAVEVMVIEVGLGGRLDSTNVVLPILSVITNISLDHTKQLGSTTALIASEKAGIIKPGIPVLSGVGDPAAAEVIRTTSLLQEAPLTRLQHEIRWESDRSRAPDSFQRATFDWIGPAHGISLAGSSAQLRTLTGLQPAYPGVHQISNAALAIGASLYAIQKCTGQDNLTEETIREGLNQVQLAGRIETVTREPWVVVDVAHNVAAIQALLQTLNLNSWTGRKTLVLAISEDKDVEGMTKLLVPHFDRIIVTRFLKNPRAVAPARLAELIAASVAGETNETGSSINPRNSRPEVVLADSPVEAWVLAQQGTCASDMICMTGSTFLIAEIRPLISLQFGLRES